MTQDEFHDIIKAQELQLLENFLIPNTLVIDLNLINQVFGKPMVGYKTPITGEIIKIAPGESGQFLMTGKK